MKNPKLSKTQQQVIDRLKEGWELASSMDMDPVVWLQENGIGKGGVSEKVRWGTLQSLLRLKVIRRSTREYPVTHYVLVEDVGGRENVKSS